MASQDFNFAHALRRYRRFVGDASHFKELIELGPAMMKGYDGSEIAESNDRNLKSNCRLAALWRYEITSRGYDPSLVPWPVYLPDYETMLAEGRAKKVAYEAAREEKQVEQDHEASDG
jgi:hypothetical protein